MNITITRTMTVGVDQDGRTVAQRFEAGKSYEMTDATRARLARAGALGDDKEVTTATPADELPKTDAEAFDFGKATKAELIDYAKRHELTADHTLKVEEYRAAVVAAAKAKAGQ